MNPKKHKYFFAIFYSIFLITLTNYFLLKTYVIAETYQIIETSEASSMSESSKQDPWTSLSSSENAGEIISNSTEYQDENIKITISTLREYDTDIYIADVYVDDISYLQSAFADNSYGRNVSEDTSQIAAENDAILAINGDYYGFRNNGYVLRNGVLYRDTAQTTATEDLVIYDDGNFDIVGESAGDPTELLQDGALQIYSFGPGLIDDGELMVDSSSEISGKSMNSNPRTAIGMIEPGHYIFIVSDGRTTASAGLSLYELASVMKDYGVTVGYNLDGGGSSTMVFQWEVINNPTSGRGITERAVSDIIYIGY